MLVEMNIPKILRIIALNKAVELGKITHERILQVIQFDVGQKVRDKRFGVEGTIESFTTDGMINWKPDSLTVGSFCDSPDSLERVLQDIEPEMTICINPSGSGQILINEKIIPQNNLDQEKNLSFPDHSFDVPF